MRTRDVDRAELRGQVDQVRVQLEPVDPVAEPRLHPVGATRRRRHVVGPVGERGDEPVVHHVAGLVEREQVASSAGSDRADVQREHAVEEHPCVPTGDEELAERRDVHQAHALAHRADLIGDVAVRAGAEPHAGVVDPRAGLDVPVVQGGPALDLFVDPADQVTQPRRANRWAGGRAAAGRDPGALRAGVLREVSRAQRPLARAHRRRRVALQDLRGGPTLVPGLLEVVHRDVLAHADVPVRLGDGPRVGLSGLVRFTPARGASGPFGVIDRASRQNDVAGTDDLGVGSHPKEGVAGRPAEGEHQCIACEGTAALGGEHRDGAHLLGAACFQDAAGDQRDLAAGRADGFGDPVTLARVRDDDGSLADPDPLGRGHPGGAAAEPHARQIVAGEHPVRLQRAGRHDHALGLDLDEPLGSEQRRRRALVYADRRVLLEDPDAGVASLGRETVDRRSGRGVGGVRAEDAFVGEEHGTFRRGARGGSEPGDAATDHERPRAHEPRGRARGRRSIRQGARAGRSADHPLGDRPEPPRPGEHLVIEPDRHQPVEPVVDRERVPLGRRPAGLSRDAHPVARRRHAGPLAGHPVDRHETVRAVAGPAVEPAATVRLQRPAERAHPGAERGRRDRVAVVDVDTAAVEPERRHRQASMRFVPMSRVTVVHRRQPSRWYHRSRWGAAALSWR